MVFFRFLEDENSVEILGTKLKYEAKVQEYEIAKNGNIVARGS